MTREMWRGREFVVDNIRLYLKKVIVVNFCKFLIEFRSYDVFPLDLLLACLAFKQEMDPQILSKLACKICLVSPEYFSKVIC